MSWLVGRCCALFGAVVLAIFAGAGRTASAYPRFLERQKAYDIQVLARSAARTPPALVLRSERTIDRLQNVAPESQP